MFRDLKRALTVRRFLREGMTRAEALKRVGLPAHFRIFPQMRAFPALGPSTRPPRDGRCFVLRLATGEELVVEDAACLDDALAKAGVHPADLRSYDKR